MQIGLSLSLTNVLLSSAADFYGVGGLKPSLVFDFSSEFYRTGGSTTTFDAAMTHTRSGNATMVDSDGVLKWAPHNLALNSATPATQSITVVSGADYTVECTGVSIALSGAGTGTVTAGNPVTITASTTTLTLTVTGSTGTMWAYRSDLGGMVDNPDTGNSYVPTTSAARYLPRRGHHIYNGAEWVNEGVLVESEARTNYLLNSGTLATQNVTVTAVPHTLHFTGTGTVTLSGVSTDGPLVGTGTGENNRVSLTFTPTAGTLTLTVSGTVTNADLEIGSTPSSHKPTSGSTVTRAADVITVPSANLPWPTPNVIGPELVTNGTFDTDISGWTGGNAVISWDAAGYIIVDDTANAGSDSNANQTISTEVGKGYVLSVDRISTTSAFWLEVFGATQLVYTGSLGTTTGPYSVTFVADSTSTSIRLITSGTGVTKYDNISVREIDPLSVSIQMDGKMTYADEGEVETVFPFRLQSGTPRLFPRLRTDSTRTGSFQFVQNAGDGEKAVIDGSDTYSPGINVPFNIASRHGSTFINGAVGGTALTANTTPIALPDLSSTDLNLAFDYMGTIKKFRVWSDDLGDTGIAEAST